MGQVSSARQVRPWWVAVVSGMASYIDAAAIISFGVAVVIYQKALGLDPVHVGVASGALTFGVAIGAIVGGRLGDRFGRRPVFSTTMVVVIAGSLALIAATSFWMVLVGASLVGLGTGADLPVSLSTISEAASDANRGKLVGFSNLLWLAGVIVASLVGGIVGNLGLVGAQVLFIHIGGFSLLLLLGRLTIPESEIWKVARANAANTGAATSRGESGAAFRALVRSPYGIVFGSLIVFYALMNLAQNTAGQYGSYLLVNVAGVDLATASVVGLPLLPISIIASLWFMRIVDKPHRFTYFRVGAVLFLASLLVPVVFGYTLVTYLVMQTMLSVGVAFAGEAIMKVWTQEQFPTLLRTSAQGIIIAVARFLAAAFATVTPLMVAAGVGVLYGTLFALGAVGVAAAWSVFRTRDSHNEFTVQPAVESAEA